MGATRRTDDIVPAIHEVIRLAAVVHQFGEFVLDCSKFELTRRGRRLKLERKPLELLILLVSRHGQVVTRNEIAQCLWGQEIFVDTEHGINTAIRKIRQTLGDSSDLPQFVQTLSGSGYRFIAVVTETQSEAGKPAHSAGALVEPTSTAIEPYLSQASNALPEKTEATAPSNNAKPRYKVRPIAGLDVLTFAVILVTLILFAVSQHFRFFRRGVHAPIGSIAVLPLQNLSGDSGQDYFAAGMTDELITELARIPNLRVVSRTSVLAKGDSSRSLPEIARKLDVEAIVEGSVVRSGDRVRITAQLIDSRTDRHLWAHSFEGSASDVLALQDSVAQQIAIQTSAILIPAPLQSVDPAAHDAYLRGRYFLNKQDYLHCLASFKEAVTLSPNYAPAQAGYASALDAATTFNIGTPLQLMPKAIVAARRAIQLDPQNAEAYTALGSVQTIYEWNWTAAEQNLTRGLSLSPSDPVAEFKYAVYLDAVGRREDAVMHMRRALELDSVSFLINLRLGVALYYDRKYEAALARLEQASDMEQSSGSVDYYLSLVYQQKSDHDKTVQYDLEAFRKAHPQMQTAPLAQAYLKHGWEAYWRERTRTLMSQTAGPCTAYQIGIDDLQSSQLKDAFKSLQNALDNHCFSMAFIRVEPLFDPVRQDTRYLALLRQMHQ